MQSDPRPIRPFVGPIKAKSAPVPGSKSHTNRALLCAALAEGRSRLSGCLRADDTEAMIGAITAIGAEVEQRTQDPTLLEVVGTDPSRAHHPPIIDVRQSGTSSRFVLPVLTTVPGSFVLDGDPQLRSRPFGPQLQALVELGAEVQGARLPLTIEGRPLPGGLVELAGDTSSQFLSGLLLAAPLMSGPLTVELVGDLVSRPYVELTVRTMEAFGCPVVVSADGSRFVVEPGRYRATELSIEPDASAASYFFAAAALCGGSVRVQGLDDSTVQGDLRFVSALARMGAEVRQGPGWTEVTGTGNLEGITIDMSDISDTAQTLAVVATAASSTTEITGIGFIRAKETDRLAAAVTELRRLGIDASETDDGMVIRPGPVSPGVVQTYDDHRMAMSFALLGLVNPGIAIADPGCVNKTFPNYFQALETLRPDPT